MCEYEFLHDIEYFPCSVSIFYEYIYYLSLMSKFGFIINEKDQKEFMDYCELSKFRRKKNKSFYTSWELLGIVSETYSANELDII